MSGHYTITAARNAGTKPNPHGGTLVKWYVGLQNSAGDQLDGVYWQRKEGSEVNVGDQIYGTVSRGEYGPRFKMEPKPEGATPPPGPQSGTNPPAVPPPGPPQAAAGPGTLDERSRRIERQHSQEMSLRTLALFPEAERRQYTDLDAEELRGVIQNWTDWFANDLDLSHSPPSTGHPQGNGGGEEKTPPPASSLEQEVDRQVESGALVEEFDEGGSF